MATRHAAFVACALVVGSALGVGGLTGTQQYEAAQAAAALSPTVEIKNNVALGSGFYIGNGVIITAGHMVLEGNPDPNSFTVIVDKNGKPGEKIHATILWADKAHDVAALHIDQVPADLGTATLATSVPAVGTHIEVVGAPLGETFIHTWGHVAGVPRDETSIAGPNDVVEWTRVLPVDVAFTNGNSGGPVYLAGTHQVIGEVVGAHLNVNAMLGVIFPGTVNFVVPSDVILKDLANPPKWSMPKPPAPVAQAAPPSGAPIAD